jgi:AraC-like DNA-binding protein
MLTHTVLVADPDLRVAAVSCSGPARWSAEEEVGTSAVVLVRRGVFARRADGRAGVADPVQGYVQRPGEVQQVAHPAGADTCTTISIAPGLADRLGRAGPVIVSPAADLAHRRLVGRAVSGTDLADLATDLIGQLLPPPARRPHHRAVDDVRIALRTDPGASLDDLAELAGCSRWHLSRTFHQVTGLTINAYRLRLRARAVLAELGDSSDGLAELAARAGFADQAHLSRTMRRELGRSPGEIRKLLSGDPASGGSIRGLPVAIPGRPASHCRAVQPVDGGGGLRGQIADQLGGGDDVPDEVHGLAGVQRHVGQVSGHAGQRHEVLVPVVLASGRVDSEDVAFAGPLRCGR